MAEITLVQDDLIPLLESYGIAAKLEAWASKNMGMSRLICRIQSWAEDQDLDLDGLDSYQVERLLADLTLAGKLTSAVLVEGSNVEGVVRAEAPPDLGASTGDVWWASGEFATGKTFRGYVNGILIDTISNYNHLPMGQQSGDTVQICQVVAGVPGWFASKAVP
jgi:hypothetical protein